MLCEECKQREATVHRTQIVNGHKTESHVCSQCAQSMPEAGMGSSSFGMNLFDDSFFSNHFFTNALYPDGMLRTPNTLRCPHCGMSFQEFNESGKFGCDSCYATFHAHIVPLVKRLQQNATSYEGKVPSRGTGIFRTKRQIKKLRQELDAAIRAENFEKAAALRDEVRSLEQSLVSGSAEA